MTKILKDVRVVEMGTYITGPAAGMHLADLGANLVRSEQAGRNPLHDVPGFE